MKKSIFALVLGLSFLGAGVAQASITRQLDLGSTGSDVTELQAYYSLDPSIYPSGLVTGYFGSLTLAGTQRFQTIQGIVSSGAPETTGFGRVGPQTLMRLNALMGGVTTQPQIIPVWDAEPLMSKVSVQYTTTNATFSWVNSEPTQGQVYYDVSPLRVDEATGPKQAPYVSGVFVQDNAGRISHSITVINLHPDTTYYYLVRAIDNTGNMTMAPLGTFRTNP